MIVVISWLEKYPHTRPDLLIWLPNIIFQITGSILIYRSSKNWRRAKCEARRTASGFADNCNYYALVAGKYKDSQRARFLWGVFLFGHLQIWYAKKFPALPPVEIFPQKNKIHRRAQIESKKDSIFQRLQNILQSAWVSVQAIDMRPKRNNKILFKTEK